MLGFYVLSDRQGSYITLNNGKYVPIRSFSHARQWQDLIKATSVLNNSIPKSIRENYRVEYHDTDKIVNKSDMSKQNEICFRTIENGNIDYWQEKIQQLTELFEGTESRFTELSSKLSDIDKEIVDVQHYIEFGKFNCYQGWICFKMLQNLLQQRRQYKNEMEVLQKIKDCKIATNDIRILSSGVSAIQNKLYTPRAFPELFRGEVHNND